MKSGNEGVANELSESLYTTQDYQKLQGRWGTAVHGVPMPETANRHSLPLPSPDWDQMCVRYTLGNGWDERRRSRQSHSKFVERLMNKTTAD